MDFNVNIWSVLVAGFVSSFLGMLWYSPALFGNQWMKLTGIKMLTGKALEKAKKEMWKKMCINFIGSTIAAYTFGLLINNTGTVGSINGAILGLIIGAGILAINALSTVLWEGKPFKLYLINIGYNITSYAIMGAILACTKWA